MPRISDASSPTYFRSWAAGADPAELLDPERQFTTPWGSSDHGSCDKCGGQGTVRYECKSCLEGGAVDECPVCHGEIHFEDVCPACEGEGVINRTRRSGIAVFPALRGLYRYLAERNADVRENVIVELEGRLSDDRDLDADAGALLIHPTGLVSVRPFDHSLLESIRSRVSGLKGSA